MQAAPIAQTYPTRDANFPVARRPALSVTVFETMADVETLWRSMESHPLVSLHQGFNWCRAWVRAHPRSLRIVTVSLDGQPALILPLELVSHRLYTSARIISAPHSNLNTGLFTDAMLDAANPALMARVAQLIRQNLTGADLVHLPELAIVWAGRRMPLAMLGGPENHNRTYQLPLEQSFEATLAKLNGKRRRKNFRTSMRKLDSFGGADYVIAANPEEQAEMLDNFFRMKSARFAEQGLPDVFADPAVRAHFHCAARARTRFDDAPLEMHGLRMRETGEWAALSGLSRKGGHVICQFTTIGQGPERVAGPGEALFYLMIEQVQSQGADLFDFGMGSSRLKDCWTTDVTVLRDVTLPITLIGKLAALKEEATLVAKGMIKQNPVLYSFIQRLRARAGSSDSADHDGPHSCDQD